MHLFYLYNSYNKYDEFFLDGDDLFRLSNVLRFKINDVFLARDKLGTDCYTLKILDINKKNIKLLVLDKVIKATEEPIPIELWQVMPKNHFEDIIKMAIEAGVSKIVPLISKFSVVKDTNNSTKLKRMTKIAEESIMQSSSFYFKELASIQNLNDALLTLTGHELVFFAHQEKLQENNNLLALLKPYNYSKIIVIIGAEGGFSDDEVKFMQQKKLNSLYYGDIIVRSEHAGLFAIGSIKMFLKEIKNE